MTLHTTYNNLEEDDGKAIVGQICWLLVKGALEYTVSVNNISQAQEEIKTMIPIASLSL